MEHQKDSETSSDNFDFVQVFILGIMSHVNSIDSTQLK
jgi:hypothetical protein